MKQKTTAIDTGKLLFGKVPPNAKEIEIAILGIMLFNPNSVKVVRGILNVEDFYITTNKIICQAIFKISEHNNPDYLLVVQELIETGQIEEVGGAYAITKLTNAVSSDTNIKQYCLTVKQTAVQRRLIDFSSHVLSSVFEGEDDVFDTIIQARSEEHTSELSHRP